MIHRTGLEVAPVLIEARRAASEVGDCRLEETFMGPVSLVKGVTLHEAMVAVMIRCREYDMLAKDIAHWNKELAIKPQVTKKPEDPVEWPDGSQIWLRAKENPDLFEYEGREGEARIRLRKFGAAPEPPDDARGMD